MAEQARGLLRAAANLLHYRQAGEEAAREAGALLRARLHADHQIRHKGDIDIVTEVDLASERLIRERLLDRFPEHSFIGEEGGVSRTGSSEYRWIVDPIDGTTNFAHGFPFFCVSIGLEIHGDLAVGVVYDPNRDEMFSAQRGGGATMNGRAIRVTARNDLRQSLLATGFPYEREGFDRALRGFERMSLASLAVRRAGSAALDLCYVACGRLDGYWEFVVKPWDVAAGVLLVEEAGGCVTRINAGTFSVECGEVLASNGAIHARMADGLAGLGT